ncbi:MAG: outer membrane protein transport protein [Leptospiraceae bacterium]|nr:outer membrane protein transport protein [Leptospiraceae bacterium]
MRLHPQNKQILRGLLAVLLPLAAAPIQANSYPDVYGATPFTAGKAGAVTAVVNDAASVFYNPAGLSLPSRAERLTKKYGSEDQKESPSYHELQLFYFGSGHSLNYTPYSFSLLFSDEKATTVNDSYAGLALTLRIDRIYKMDRKVAFGLYASLPGNGKLLSINDVNPTVHRFLQHGKSLTRPYIAGALSGEIWKDHLYLGVGFTALVRGQGAILMKDVLISPETVIPDQQVIIDIEPAANTQLGLTGVYGDFYAGVYYRRELDVQLDPVNARARTLLLGLELDLDLAVLDHYQPRAISYGMGYRLFDTFLFSVDVRRELWSRFELSRTKKTYSDQIFFADTTSVGASMEFDVTSWFQARMGYRRAPTPVPDQPGSTNWMGNDRRVYSAGFTFMLWPSGGNLMYPVAIDVSLESQKLEQRTVLKYNPTENNPFYTYGGVINHFGLGVVVHF